MAQHDEFFEQLARLRDLTQKAAASFGLEQVDFRVIPPEPGTPPMIAAVFLLHPEALEEPEERQLRLQDNLVLREMELQMRQEAHEAEVQSIRERGMSMLKDLMSDDGILPEPEE